MQLLVTHHNIPDFSLLDMCILLGPFWIYAANIWNKNEVGGKSLQTNCLWILLSHASQIILWLD